MVNAPHLTYFLDRSQGRTLMDTIDAHTGVVGDIALWDAHEVYAGVTDAGRLGVQVQGRMLTRAGGAGPARTCTVDLSETQPTWLADIVLDAFHRLPEAIR